MVEFAAEMLERIKHGLRLIIKSELFNIDVEEGRKQ